MVFKLGRRVVGREGGVGRRVVGREGGKKRGNEGDSEEMEGRRGMYCSLV